MLFSRVFDGEQSIRLATNMPTGYLGKGALASDIRWVDANRSQFKFAFRLVSSTYTSDVHLHKFFAHCETTLVTPPEVDKKSLRSTAKISPNQHQNGNVSNGDDVTTAAAGAAGAKSDMLTKLKVTSMFVLSMINLQENICFEFCGVALVMGRVTCVQTVGPALLDVVNLVPRGFCAVAKQEIPSDIIKVSLFSKTVAVQVQISF